jgi:hypothetical protein
LKKKFRGWASYRQPLSHLGITTLLAKPFNTTELLRSIALKKAGD